MALQPTSDTLDFAPGSSLRPQHTAPGSGDLEGEGESLSLPASPVQLAMRGGGAGAELPLPPASSDPCSAPPSRRNSTPSAAAFTEGMQLHSFSSFSMLNDSFLIHS
jgi:hypothetical protein